MSWISLGALFGALAACAGLVLAASAGAHARSTIHALVVNNADNPVLDALKNRHGIRIHHSRHERSHSPRDYDMLIVDGDALSARKLAHRRAFRRFAQAHRPVLALDMNDKHFDRAIDDRTGFSVSGPHGRHSSDAFYFHRGLTGTTPRTVIVEAPELTPSKAKRMSHRTRRRLTRRQARRMSHVVHDDVVGRGSPASTAPPQDAGIPPELQHVGWTYSVIGHWLTSDGYWTDGYLRRCGCAISAKDDAGGAQSANWTMNYNFDVYLDNDPSRPVAQHHQILTYNLDGQFAPKRPQEDFFRMDDLFSAGLSPYAYHLERAWWTGTIGVQADPDPATDQKLVWQASEPESINSEHEYSSGQDFTVGFSGSNEGAEVSASYGVHSETTNSVPDWGVENKTAGDHLSWRFSSRAPCDPRPDHYDREQCFDKAEANGTYWGPHQPNDLSTGQMQIHTSGRWNTKGGSSNVLTGNDAQLNLSVDTPITLADTYCDDFEFGVCPRGSRKIAYQAVGPGPTKISIDAGQVVPVGIDSLVLSPNPTNGTAKQKVTGTVTLEKPAPRDTAIVIYSDSKNASVGAQSGRGSQTSITVPEGSSSQSFTILTNDNNLAAGGHTTADITAFYQDPTTEQLTVCAGSPPC